MKNKHKNRVIIEISGGVLCSVYVDNSKAKLTLIDWDNAERTLQAAEKHLTRIY